MSTFTLPDSSDIRDTIADCLDSLGIAPQSERARIVENCLAPVALLFEAGETACAAGPQERAVFAYFLSLMGAQARGFGDVKTFDLEFAEQMAASRNPHLPDQRP